MEERSTIQLTDENLFPSDSVLQSVLGPGYAVYLELLQVFQRRGVSLEWRYYRDGKAWLGKAQHKKRTLVWMSAWKGFIKATVYLADKDVPGLEALALSPATRQALAATKRVGKSLPCTFDLTGPDPLRELEAVMVHKQGTGGKR